MNSYKTVSQATGVARTLSRSAGCTMLVYQAADQPFRHRSTVRRGQWAGDRHLSERIQAAERAARLTTNIHNKSG